MELPYENLSHEANSFTWGGKEKSDESVLSTERCLDSMHLGDKPAFLKLKNCIPQKKKAPQTN